MKTLTLLTLMAFLLPSTGYGGMVVRYRHTSNVVPGDQGTTSDTVSYQEGDRARADIFRNGEKAPSFTVLVDATKETFTMIQHGSKSYTTMNPKQVAGVMQGLQHS